MFDKLKDWRFDKNDILMEIFSCIAMAATRSDMVKSSKITIKTKTQTAQIWGHHESSIKINVALFSA